MTLRVYNTLARGMEEFVPLADGCVGLYTCGPTVYDYAHIGNYRAYIFEDILRRCLLYNGLVVTQVMNLTDVDDKTIRSAHEEGVSLDTYTRTFKDAFFEDLKVLNIEPAEHYPEATGHVLEMIAIIEALFEKGLAYKSDDGSVYFSIAKFPAYGRLARLDRSGMRSGVRVNQDEYEKDAAADFALWKAWQEEDGDVGWDSPWGRGRPGWHIECTAMSMKYLGESFDIHTGGVDNIFPHHEDEIAQSEGATGKPFVKYWLHCGHLVVDGRKMSKSLGNFYTLRDILDRGYSGREVRYVLLSAQYRQSLNFTFNALDAARVALGRVDEFRTRLREAAGPGTGEDSDGALPSWAEQAEAGFRAGLNNDLNVPEALGALFDMVRDGHRALDGGWSGPQCLGVASLLDDFDRVLGVLQAGEEQAGDEIRLLCEARQAARTAKNWAEADRIRDQLAELGWEARDTPEGAKLRRIKS